MPSLITSVIFMVIIYFIILIYNKLTSGRCTSKNTLLGKTVLITGSDKGIGYETVLDLARRKARIIMACRDFENAKKVADEIKLKTGNDQIFAKKLDVSSLACVKKFSDDFLETEKDLHILILNAGIPSSNSKQIERTHEGFEKVFATNYLGHFLLTMLLLDLLKSSQPSRIIFLSSILHNLVTELDIEDLNSEKTFQPNLLYGRTKLLAILFAKEMTRQLKQTGVTINCLHPGIVSTNIFAKMPEPWNYFSVIFSKLFFRSPRDGAQTSIYLSVSDEVEDVSGLYFCECKPKKTSTLARDDDLATNIFMASENYCSKYLVKEKIL